MRIILCLFACTVLLVGCDKFGKKGKPSNIEAHCVMNGYGAGKCSFTNKGAPGSQCVKVQIFLQAQPRGKSLTSSTVCSGTVGSRETKSKEYSIPGVNDFCAQRGVAWTKVCAFRVLNDD